MKKTILILFLIFSKIVFGCDCPPLSPISAAELEKYDIVFWGRVESVEACDGEKSKVHFFVTELYKGVAERHIEVIFDCSSSCSMSFEKNEEWLLYSKYAKFNQLIVSFCSHSRKYIKEVEKDYYTIASGKTFEEEKKYLQTELGIQNLVQRNNMIDQQNEFKHQNQLPSGMNVLLLLGVSLIVMVVIYFVTKKYFKNGK